MLRASSKFRSPPIAPREWAVAVCGSVTLAFTAWGLGGVVAWSLHTMLVAGLATFFCAFCPLPAKLNGVDGRHGNWKNLKRLLRTPIFWFSAAFLAYITLQALNPAAEVVRNERGWWVEGIQTPLATWLPTSVRSDYEPMNAWRILVMHTAAVSLALGLLVGLTRRVTICAVIWSLFANGVAMAVVAIIQKLTDAEKILWTVSSENPQFWGSFFYRNHCGAYFAWLVMVGSVLYFYHSGRARKLGASGGPHFLCLLLNAVILLSAFMANSRAGILFSGALFLWLMILLVADFIVNLSHTNWLSGIAIGVLLALMFGGLCYFGAKQVDWVRLQERFGGFDELREEIESGQRVLASRATYDMASDRLHYGWGAGSFRYIFPMYQRNYPTLFYSDWLVWEGKKGRDFFRYAHNDILQFLSEYGFVGCFFLLGCLVALLYPAVTGFFQSFYLSSSLLIALGLSFLHACIDFTYHSPAYWVALLGGIAVAGRLIVLTVAQSR